MIPLAVVSIYHCNYTAQFFLFTKGQNDNILCAQERKSGHPSLGLDCFHPNLIVSYKQNNPDGVGEREDAVRNYLLAITRLGPDCQVSSLLS